MLGECQEQHAKFYTAGVVLAFEHMHSKSAESLAPFLLCNLSANNNSNSLSRKKQLIQLTISTDLVIIQELGYSYKYSSLHRRNSCSCLRAGALGQRLFSHLKEISASVTGQLSLSLSLALDTCDYVI